MKTYTLWVSAGDTETADVAERALLTWLAENQIEYRGSWARYNDILMDFIGESDTHAEFCATNALLECGLNEFPVKLLHGPRVLRAQTGALL